MVPAALFLDLNGVLYDRPDEMLPGAVETVNWARRCGLPLRFVTNTSTRDAARIRSDLAGIGIAVEEGELFTAPLAARAWIQERGLTPHCLVHPALRSTFADLEGGAPNCVVLGDARGDLTYDALNRVFRLVMEGAPLVGLGMNRRFREGGEWMLDAGGFIRAIAWAAEVEPVVTGKPSAVFFRQLVADVGVPASECLMVGDERRCGEALVIDGIADLPRALEGPGIMP